MDKATCRYCGAEMELNLSYVHAQYECRKCGAKAPYIAYDEYNQEPGLAEEAALSAALQRYELPNRVLMLDEVTGSNEPCVFLEIKGKEPIWACDCVISSNLNGVNISFIGDRGCTLMAIFDYCKTWRCWLRRPTDEERQSVAWDQ